MLIAILASSHTHADAVIVERWDELRKWCRLQLRSFAWGDDIKDEIVDSVIDQFRDKHREELAARGNRYLRRCLINRANDYAREQSRRRARDARDASEATDQELEATLDVQRTVSGWSDKALFLVMFCKFLEVLSKEHGARTTLTLELDVNALPGVFTALEVKKRVCVLGRMLGFPSKQVALLTTVGDFAFVDDAVRTAKEKWRSTSKVGSANPGPPLHPMARHANEVKLKLLAPIEQLVIMWVMLGEDLHELDGLTRGDARASFRAACQALGVREDS